MTVTDTSTETSLSPSWANVAKKAAIWLFGCSGAGFILAEIDGEFGSVVFLVVGVLVGLSGAICHSTLARRPHFMRRSSPAKATILWFGAMVLPIAWTVLGALTSSVPVSARYVASFCGGIAAMALVASVSITLYERHLSV